MNNNGLVVAYLRLSEEDLKKEKEYSESIYNQLGCIKSYAKSMGLNIDREYIDDGYSGVNFDRPAFENLKNDIDNHLISIVITKDMSRLGRNFIDTAYYISEYFPKNNVRYIAINDNFDSNNPNNEGQKIILNIQSIINDRYVKDVSDKRKRTAMLKTESGEYIGVYAPYGYKIKKVDNKRTLEIDEYSANIVKKIFTEIASGKTRQEVSLELNNLKIIPPMVYLNMTSGKGKKYSYDWSDKIVYRIIKNHTYTGSIVKRKTEKLSHYQKKRTVIPIRDRKIINHCHPAIIKEELFDAANSRLREMKRKEKNFYNGLFSGLVVCGTCGRVMTACRVQKKGRKVQYYFECTRVNNNHKCKSRNIADSKLRTIFKETLENIINNYVDEDEIINKATNNLISDERVNTKISYLKKDIELHNVNIRNLYLKKSTGEITLDEFIKEKDKETKLKENSEKLLREKIESKNIMIRKTELLEKYNQFINNGEYINDIVREVVNQIIVYNDNTLVISFKFGLGEPR